MEINKKILVIAGCSSKKLLYAAPAKNLYQGTLFKKIKKLVTYNQLDFMILSAKYGIIHENDIIKPYNKTLKNKNDILKLRKKVIPKLKAIELNYDLIIIIMGKKYRDVLSPLFDDNKYKMIYDQRGIGGLTAKLNKLINNPLNIIIKELIPCKIS